MPSNLEYLGENAFYETISLRKVSFSEGLKNIYRYTFAESGIEEVSLPDSLEYIGYGAFENTNLKKSSNSRKSRKFVSGRWRCRIYRL